MRSKGTGSIYKRTRNGKTVWEGRVHAGYDPGTGKRITKYVYGATQREVQRKMNELMNELDKGTYREPNEVTVGDWMDTFIDVYCRDQLKPYTVTKYEGDIRNHVKPRIGRIRLQALAGIDMQKMANDMIRSGSSVKTVKNIIGLCHHAFEMAVKDGMILYNPADRVRLAKGAKREIRPLEDAEVPVFLDAIRGHRYEHAFAVSLFAGLREGECLGLSWRQVDLKNRTLLIDQQLQMRDGAWVTVPYTKSSRARRIEIPPIAVEYLRDRELQQMRDRLKNAAFWDNEFDLVFTNEIGDPISTTTYYKNFKAIAASIGRPDLRPHDLRHTAATIAIASGADIKSVQDLLGHATASFTLNVYAHTSEKMMHDTANRVQDYYSSLGIKK